MLLDVRAHLHDADEQLAGALSEVYLGAHAPPGSPTLSSSCCFRFSPTEAHHQLHARDAAARHESGWAHTSLDVAAVASSYSGTCIKSWGV
jgi:hypothetical protein